MAEEKQQQEDQQIDIPDNLPLLPVRDIVIFPYMVLPLFVGREISIKAINESLAGNRMILLTAQRLLDVETPKPEDIYAIGTVGMIMRMLKLPDGRVKILVQGIAKAKIETYTQKIPYFRVKIRKIDEPKTTLSSLETEALIRTVKEQVENVTSAGKLILPEVIAVIENLNDPGRLGDIIISNIVIKVEEAQEILEILDPFRSMVPVFLLGLTVYSGTRYGCSGDQCRASPLL